MTFQASSEAKQGIIHALNCAIMHLYKQADDVIGDPEFSDLEDMYRADAADHEVILDHFIRGDYSSACNTFWHMDTASRDNVFAFFPNVDSRKAFDDFLLEGGALG